ncbi:MAG: TM2 domain-containing protein [Bacteroidales bacterium]|nr:TM2 domain-containing protein [Bacteroidales bacterium]
MALILCKECGKEISDSAANCPHCGAPVVKDVFCKKCGAKIPENVEFCPNCGDQSKSVAKALIPAKKDRMVAALLALFLGSLGIHYFYLGKSTAGILTIVISFCSCGIWGIVMFVQAILMLMMSDSDFEAKYVNTEKSFPLF